MSYDWTWNPPPISENIFLPFFNSFLCIYANIYPHKKDVSVWWYGGGGGEPTKQTKHPHWSACSTSFCRTLSIIEAFFYICWLKHLVSCLCSRNSWERLTPTHTWCAAVKLKRVRAKERKRSVLEDCFLFIQPRPQECTGLGITTCRQWNWETSAKFKYVFGVFKSYVCYACTHKYVQYLDQSQTQTAQGWLGIFSFWMKFQKTYLRRIVWITVELDLTFVEQNKLFFFSCTHCLKCSLAGWLIAVITKQSAWWWSKTTQWFGLMRACIKVVCFIRMFTF